MYVTLSQVSCPLLPLHSPLQSPGLHAHLQEAWGLSPSKPLYLLMPLLGMPLLQGVIWLLSHFSHIFDEALLDYSS